MLRMSFIFVITIGLAPSCFGCSKISPKMPLKSHSTHRKQPVAGSIMQRGVEREGPAEALRKSELELDQLSLQFQKQAHAISEKEFSAMSDAAPAPPTIGAPLAASKKVANK